METIKVSDLNRTHNITKEEVKAVPMFADLTDDQAQEIIETIMALVIIIFKYHEKVKSGL